MNFEDSFRREEKDGFKHACMQCGQRPYRFGNMGLCYMCVQEENKDTKLKEELCSYPIQISIGRGALNFIMSQLDYIKNTHDGSYYYNARSDFVKRILREQLPTPQKKATPPKKKQPEKQRLKKYYLKKKKKLPLTH